MKRKVIIWGLMSACFLTGGLAHAQGFGHGAAIAVRKRLAQIKNFERPVSGKSSYLKSDVDARYRNLSFSGSYTSDLATRVARASAQAASIRSLSADPLAPKVPAYPTSLLASTFQARPVGNENFISGTVFKTSRNGQDEIYGVISMHGLGGPHSWREMVSRRFTADVFDPVTRRFVSVPAEVVQISTSEFLDVALVKFNKQHEFLLHPLSLSTQNPTRNTALSSHGFVRRQSTYIEKRIVTKTEPFVLQTTMPVPRVHRAGLCGGPVVNSDGALVGIHNGSSCRGDNEGNDKGYVTPAWVLERMVYAYNHGGKAPVALTVDDKTLLELNVDEYISNIVLKSSDEQILGYYTVDYKFSYTSFQELLEEHYARYIDFTVQRVQWSQSNLFLEDSRFDAPDLVKVYRYDTETDELKPLEPAPAQTKKKWSLFHLFRKK